MSYLIELGQWNQIFAVPAAVVDRHLRLASEAQVKVLLYLLRSAGSDQSDDAVAKAIGISADEVQNAVEFWIDRGVFRNRDTAPAPAEAAKQTITVANEVPATAEPKKAHTALSRAVRPDSGHVSHLIATDANFSGLVSEAQRVMGKLLAPGDTAMLAMLYDTCGLPCEVIAMLLCYVAESGSANMRTVERMGLAWSDRGVNTVDAAEREIERMANSREAWGRVSSLLGIRNAGRPTEAQLSNAERWLVEWGFNDEMIVEAYERCVNTKGTYHMSYVNAILKKWYEKRIFSLDALRAEEARPASAKQQKKPNKKGSVFSADGASFDMEAYESKSLFDD